MRKKGSSCQVKAVGVTKYVSFDEEIKELPYQAPRDMTRNFLVGRQTKPLICTEPNNYVSGEMAPGL